MKKKRSQKEKIAATLITNHSITPRQALDSFGCFRLAAVIFDLREEGWDITTQSTMGKNGNSFATYELVSLPKKVDEYA
tara:strand:- start:160 stop:396 length:237 start_codon:yes stop_codon:yes gene_type:complete